MTNQPLTGTLTDQNDVPFTYQCDNYNPLLGVYINFIDYKLNTKTSIKSSINVLLNQARFAGHLTKQDTVEISEQGLRSIPTRIYDDLNFSFFKSRLYHAAIACHFKKQYLLVVENGVEFDKANLTKLGIAVVSKAEYQAALNELALPNTNYAAVRKMLGVPDRSNKQLIVRGRSVVELDPQLKVELEFQKASA